jgi:NADPH-dependent curcumin reductase CurA
LNDVFRRVRLTRPGRLASAADAFEVVECGRPEPGPGEVLVRVDQLSLDPYQKIYLRSLDTGATPPAGAVGHVIASRDKAIPEGSWVTGELGWADHALVVGQQLTIVQPASDIPLHHYVGLLGLSGLTAFFGVTEVLRPQAGAKIVVSGAYGGVGQVACQIVRRMGADVVGVVGSAQKRAALAELGISSVDYHRTDWAAELSAWAPQGIDGYFDNVWGDTSSAVVKQLRPLSRIALCGQMSGLAGHRVPPLDIDWYLILARSLTLQGFRTVDYTERWADARQQLAEWFRSGELRQDVRLVRGLEQVGDAFEDLLHGRSVGKTIVSPRPASGA